MPMIPFYTKYLDLAVDEKRMLTVFGRDDLPDGEYGFVELYCNEAGCDCRRVIISVVTPTTDSKVWATLNYGRENLEFYERWLGDKENAVDCKGPSLDPINPQTKYSPVLLGLFEQLLTDEKYVERLKRHYELFKRPAKTGSEIQLGCSSRIKQRKKKKRR